MRNKTLKIITFIIFFLFAAAFVAKFAGPNIIKLYVENGIGDCQKIPILRMTPENKETNISINNDYAATLMLYKFPKLSVSLPKGFTVTQEAIKKVYYKKRRNSSRNASIYLLYEEPNFFINLFPEVKKNQVNDNFEFIKRVMYAKSTNMKNFNDAFFVIMKSIFTPDIGDQKNAKMTEFNIKDKNGFLNYTLSELGNYFDCNIIDDKGNFFKIYIKDSDATLNLDKVFTIISTISN